MKAAHVAALAKPMRVFQSHAQLTAL